jgi:uncharacterized protein YjbI with pentapeptide repeats
MKKKILLVALAATELFFYQKIESQDVKKTKEEVCTQNPEILRNPEIDRIASTPDKNFSNKRLIKECFNSLTLYGANFEDADVSGSKFKGTQLQGANFRGAIAQGSDFTGAHLRPYKDYTGKEHKGADFTDANLKKTYWITAHLEGAIFKGADLTGATLYNPQTGEKSICDQSGKKADFSGATWVEGQLCEEGSLGYCKVGNKKLKCDGTVQ